MSKLDVQFSDSDELDRLDGCIGWFARTFAVLFVRSLLIAGGAAIAFRLVLAVFS